MVRIATIYMESCSSFYYLYGILFKFLLFIWNLVQVFTISRAHVGHLL